MYARDILGAVFRDGSANPLAMIRGWDGDPITSADIQAIRYTILLLDADDDEDLTKAREVTGHVNVAITPSAVLSDTPKQDGRWAEAGGYNFDHTVNVAVHPAFTISGRKYLIVYTLTPAEGQPIIVRFRTPCK